MLASLAWKAIGVTVVFAAIGGGIAYWSIHEYNAGKAAAYAAVAAQDQEAVDAVNKAVAVMRDCSDTGGVWRASSGKCERR